MASRFQSRLVGTVILAALGVIILPDVLDGKKSHYQDDISPIPIRPESQVDVAAIAVPDPLVDQTELPSSPVNAVIKDVTTDTPKVDTPQADTIQTATVTPDVVKTVVSDVKSENDFQDSAWIIQLMALRNADNAARLVEDLKKRGFTASSKRENDFTRILIGPDVLKEKLEKQLVELEKITGAKGQLIKFKPLNP
jgi:DedD protein